MAVPPTPTIVAAPTTDLATSCPAIQLQVQCEVNLLSAVDSSLETGVGTWIANGNCAIAQSNAQAQDGSFSLSMTSSAAGTMNALDGENVVQPSNQYTAVASFRTAVSARSVNVSIAWYDSSHTIISVPVGSNVADTTSGWTQAFVTATAPVNAAFARPQVTVLGTGAGSEVHYVDEIGLFPGSYTTWSLGGWLPNAGVVVTRSDGIYVRWASLATPAYLSNAPPANAQQLVTINDYEAIPSTPYTYTAQVVSGAAISAASNPVAASLSSNQWWWLDPTIPWTAINAQPVASNPQQYEQGSAHQVLGQTSPIYVSYSMQNLDLSATIETFDLNTYTKFLALLAGQKTVWASNPFGYGYYLRLAPAPGGMGGGAGSKAHDIRLMPSTGPGIHASIAITGIAQPRPPV